MGSCIKTGKTLSPRNTKKKPTIIDSVSHTVELNLEANQSLMEVLKKEALINEQKIQKAKQEANDQKHFTKISLNEANKTDIHSFIKKNDLISLHEYVCKNGIAPHEEIGSQGYYYTAIHYACSSNAKYILEYFCRAAYHHFQNDYEKIMNSQTYEGETPLMIIARNGDKALAETFLKFGGIDIDIKDKRKLIASTIAKNEKKLDIYELLLSNKDFKTISNKELEELNEKEYFIKWKASIIKGEEPIPIFAIDGLSDEETMKSIKNAQTSEVYKITDQCIKSQKNFIDPTFPHDLQGFTSINEKSRYAQWTLARWLRPHEIFQNTYTEIRLFEKIDPNSILQGTLDTCHFLAVLSSLAEYPERVKAIFQQTEINKYGVYAVNFYLNGKPKEIIVDDYFPCFFDKLEPIFVKTDGKQIWPLILEKAWCKMFESYRIVEIEVVYEAMEDILGAPSLGYWVKSGDKDQMFLKLLEWNKNEYLLSATSGSNLSIEGGIVANHTYSILGVYEAFEYKIIKLRNPWGSLEWKGLFSDNSSNWTDEIKKKANYEIQINDGVFVMTLEEFYNRFSHVSICLFHDNWIYQYLEINTNKSTYFSIKLEKEQEVCIRVHQENEKTYSVKKMDYNYSPLEMILFSSDGGFIETGADSKYLGKKSLLINNKGYTRLPAGEYYLRVKIHFKNKKIKPAVISTYSEEKIRFELFEYQKGKEFFFKSLTKMAKNFDKPTKFQNENCELKFDWLDHIGVIYLKSYISNLWNVTIKIEKQVNIKIGKKSRIEKTDDFFVQVKPNGEDIMILKKIELHATAKFTKKIFEAQF